MQKNFDQPFSAFSMNDLKINQSRDKTNFSILYIMDLNRNPHFNYNLIKATDKLHQMDIVSNHDLSLIR